MKTVLLTPLWTDVVLESCTVTPKFFGGINRIIKAVRSLPAILFVFSSSLGLVKGFLKFERVELMNYIRQVNAFYIHLETNSLTAATANLWHVLMHVNNRAGWREEITVAVCTL